MLPLKGVKVLDLTIMGGYTGMELADYGAEVIKIERPNEGDFSRNLGPFKDGVSIWQTFIDRGKKSITLDLNTSDGIILLKELVKDVDVVIENLRADELDNLGIGYKELEMINPKLVYARLASLENERDYVAYDTIAQAKGGIVDITGFAHPQKPSKLGVSVGAHYASLYASTGIVLALYNAKVNGHGQKIEVSMTESLFTATEDKVVIHDLDNENISRIGNAHTSINPYDILKCKDGFIALGISTDDQWAKFCEEFGLNDWIDNPKYSNNISRGENYFGDLRDKLESVLQNNYTKAELNERCSKIKVPAAGCNTVAEAMNEEQLSHREMIIKVKDNRIGEIDMTGKVIKFHDEENDTLINSAPILGEHNEEIYSKIISKQKLEELKANQII